MNEERRKMSKSVPNDLSVGRFASVRAQEIVALTNMIGEFFPQSSINICLTCFLH